jgi:hypothetical protein
MEKENLQQKIMEMDETIELLEGSNQVRADTTLRMVNTPAAHSNTEKSSRNCSSLF